MSKNENPECDLCTGIKDDTYLITENEHWKLYPHLDPATNGSDQHYLGRAVAISRSHIPDLPDLIKHPQVASDFFKIIGIYKDAVKEAFGANHFNWMALMNYGWPDPHLHFHLYPRYDHPVIFAGITFIDETFGNPVNREKRIVPAETKIEIIREIQKYIP